MPQMGMEKKVGEIPYVSGDVQTFDLKAKCEGRVLESLTIKVPFTSVVTTAGTAVTLNPYTLTPLILVKADRGGIWHQGDAYDYRLRDCLFSRIGAVEAETGAENTTAGYYYFTIPFIPPGGQRELFGLNLRTSGEVSLQIGWSAWSALVAGTGVGSFTVAPKAEIYAKTSKANWEPRFKYETGVIDKSSLGTSAVSKYKINLPVGAAGTQMGYTHMGIRVMDNVATSGRAHIAYATTSLTNISLIENGNDGEFPAWGPHDGADLQRNVNQQFRMPDGVQNGVYFAEWLASNYGDYTRTIGASGLESLALQMDHGAFATGGAIRVFYGHIKALTQPSA